MPLTSFDIFKPQRQQVAHTGLKGLANEGRAHSLLHVRRTFAFMEQHHYRSVQVWRRLFGWCTRVVPEAFCTSMHGSEISDPHAKKQTEFCNAINNAKRERQRGGG